VRPTIALICALSITLSLSLAWAQNRCEHALLGEAPSAHSELTKQAIANEFDLVMNDYNVDLIDRLVNKGQEPTPQELADFKLLLGDLRLADKKLSRQVEYQIEHKVTPEQGTALKLARTIGRNEAGKDRRWTGHLDNYTETQIARKDRILELAGFSFEERVGISSNKFLEDVLTKFAAENLVYDNVAKTPQEAVEMNKKVLSEMTALANQRTPKTRRLQVLDKKQIHKLYEEVTRHPVARLLNIKKYDPEGGIGFCFGRALTAHVEATQMGVDQGSIRKVFVVGQMKALVGDIVWQFHVATAVKNNEGGWTVIDPFIGKPISIEAWYEKMYKQDIKGTLRLYVTEATRLGATSSGRYNKANLMMDFYNGYFEKIAEYYKLKAAGQLPKKQLWVKVLDLILSVLHIGI